jgi:hypothetical protein
MVFWAFFIMRYTTQNKFGLVEKLTPRCSFLLKGSTNLAFN